MQELLFPRTDAGVLVQTIAAAVLCTGAVAASWRRPDVRVFVIGISLLLIAFLGLRALH